MWETMHLVEKLTRDTLCKTAVHFAVSLEEKSTNSPSAIGGIPGISVAGADVGSVGIRSGLHKYRGMVNEIKTERSAGRSSRENMITEGNESERRTSRPCSDEIHDDRAAPQKIERGVSLHNDGRQNDREFEELCV